MEAASRTAGHSRLDWTDPKVVSGVLVWLVFAALLHARFRPEMRGRRVMLLTLVAFLCLAFATIGVDLLHITSHGIPQPRTEGSGLRTQDSGLRIVDVSAGQALPYWEHPRPRFRVLGPFEAWGAS
jgi:hypothetical protein